MLFQRALNPSRIARTLVTVIALSFLQTVVAPVVAPIVSLPKAKAVSATITPTIHSSGTSIMIPTGVFSVTIEAVGGGGGQGGDDVNSGLAGTVAGRTIITLPVTPGDVIGLFPGNRGVDGGDCATSNGGGAGGASTISATNLLLSGSYYNNLNFSGGTGGNAGSFGCSGGGGGAGAASVATINFEIVAIAGGAGGGGGTGSGSNVSSAWSGTLDPNGTSFSGSNGTSTVVCTGSNSNADGGGGGGGGGGYYAGKGGLAPFVNSECAGTSGSPGGNYVVSGATSVTNDRVAQSSEGYVIYTYNANPTSACSTQSSTYDIYTIEKITYTGNCTWTVPAAVNVIDYFMVGGGAGGAGDGGGGGGGGASVLRTAVAVTPGSSINLKVGSGGGGGSWGWVSNAYPGSPSTITINGTTVSASSGSTNTGGPGQAGGAGGAAINGGFAGGQGGTGATCNGAGSAGKTGSTNYFYGVKNEYGGGGGGGSCPNGVVQTAPAGASGGGSGGYASGTSTNQPGAAGTANTGGGGGGGTATGTGLKLHGGKGGSGVILIRYATNSADAFPVALSSSLAGRWTPDGLQVLDSSRMGWADSSGYYTAGVVSGTPTVTTTGTMDGANATGSTKTNLVASGNTSAKATLIATNIPNYTVFHIARYITGGTQSRIITAKDNNWLSGHYSATNYKTAYHSNDWMTPYVSADVKWLLSTDQVRMYRANGSDITYSYSASQVYNSTTSPTGFGINNYSNEQSNWQTLDILAFNRQLTNGEIRSMETYLARIYGLTLSYEFQHAETDTAMSFNGNQYFYTQYTYNNVINDTFTIEAWIKPSSTCSSTRCVVFSKEYAIMFGVINGQLYYIMYGTSTAWQWVDNIYKIPMDEWHHIALVKRGVANTNGGVDIYVDGQLVYTKAGSPYLTSTSNVTFVSTDVVRQNDDQWTYIGTRLDTLDRFYGEIDEVKVWKVARTGDQIKADMNSTDFTNTQLQYYWDFNKSIGVNATRVPNLATGGPSRGDLIPAGTTTYSDVKVTTTSAAYTTITFPRSYLNQYGGWKVPDSITAASTLVVGGGGGGGYNSGGGGGGAGVIYTPTQSISGYIPITVGVGGSGSNTSGSSPSSGTTTTFASTAAPGGNPGSLYPTLTGGSGVSTSTGTSGSGGNGTSSSTVSGGNGGLGISSSITGTATTYGNGGGGGGWTTNTNGGYGGGSSSYTCCGSGGSTGSRNGKDGTANRGGGGGAGSASGFAGGAGGSGVVILRYITALKPTFTPPTNAYLNVGMTETFTTNVAQDSATAQLTRTFRWESTTAGAGGTYTTIKQGTGAANAAYSWIPSDTSTSGSQYLYRVIVTDSDTAGLYIQDTSTAVYAVINKTLVMTGVNTIKKQINVARNETFTIADGTPGYRYTLSPVIPGITLDTSTVGSTVLRISDTASVGTYLETLTVTDSVSASVVIPLSITISAPPTLVNNGEIISNNQIFHVDFGNSSSYNTSTGAVSDLSGTKKAILVPNGATYSTDYSGVLSFATGSSQYMSATAFTQYNAWTIETWIRLDAEPSSYFCPLTSEYNPTNISFELCVDATRTMWTGFHNGSWTYKRSNEQLPIGAWTHLVGTYDGSTVNFYINGVPITVKDSNTAAGTVPPQPSTNRVFINKGYGTAVGTTPTATYGSLRMYDVGFTQADAVKNYNATKDRFATNNLNQLKPSQKYGTLNLESFTVTSGGDTKTITFAVGNRTGVKWDTATAGVLKLSVQESLTPGTYFDTITVTDDYAQSTSLPIKFTVSKADTITVIAGAATTQVYNTQQATALPNFTISGLVSSDTGTVVRKYTGVDWTKPCSQGGGCEVGDTGPGGGTIFYISPTVINAATGISTGGTYLEVAPRNWSGLSVESTTAWAKATTSVTGTLSAIGSGAENTRLINNALTTNSVAAKIAADLTLNGKSDWFLPSTLEVKEMYDALYVPGLAGDLGLNNYWSSTQSTSALQADTYWFGNGGLVSPTAKTNSYVLRPIRAYSPDTATTTTTPTNVDSYTVTIDTVTMTTGSLSHYENTIFQKSGLDITKARQAPLNVQLYGGTFGVPFTITLLGGSGTGAMSESLTAGSTATGCSISAHVLTSTSAGACNLVIKKAASRNYLLETASAVVYLLNWIINQPSNATGGGSTIGLNGATSVTLNQNVAPTITELSTYTAQAGVTQLIIRGAGFNHLDVANITVKFWRNKIASGFTINGLDTEITVTVPAGTTTGKVTVTTPYGMAVSELPLTITP